jgi:hypothetical protein
MDSSSPPFTASLLMRPFAGQHTRYLYELLWSIIICPMSDPIVIFLLGKVMLIVLIRDTSDETHAYMLNSLALWNLLFF